MNKNYLLTCCILLFALVWVNAQNLMQPELRFSHACVSEYYTSFGVGFSFTERSFEANNVFYVELSDANGDFNNATVLAEVPDKNTAFEFEVALDFPKNLSGKGYRVRMRATAPAMTSPASDAFEAYYVSNADLVLNNYEASSLCASEVTLLELNVDVASTYIWYKDGAFFAETDQPYLTVDVAGKYYVEPYYGACSGSNFSNIVTVEALVPFEVQLSSGPEVVVCDGTNVTLSAETRDEMYSYQWYHNDRPLNGAVQPTWSFAASANTYGSYYLEVINAYGCEAVSGSVEVKPAAGITLEALSPLRSVILGEASALLSVQANTSGVEVVWYRNDQEISRGTDLFSYEAETEGSYYAEVTTTQGCLQEVTSARFQVYEPVDFHVLAEPEPAYEACESSAAMLKVLQLTAVLSNGDEFPVDSALYGSFGFQWIKDGAPVAGNAPEHYLDLYTDSGTYSLEVSYKNNTFASAPFEVFIGLPEAVLLQESMLTCDSPALLTVSPLTEVIYNWYLNEALVASGFESEFFAEVAGNYRVTMEYMGCIKELPAISVASETESLVTIEPGSRVALMPDNSVELSAEGADTYLWTDASGEVLSAVNRLTVEDEGIYYLQATVGSCEVVKSVEVFFNLTASIPNVVTPNGDRVNDTWALPKKLLDAPDLEVIICDSYGNPVLQTKQYDNTWPASASASVLREPNYYYILNRGGKSIQKGVITLVR